MTESKLDKILAILDVLQKENVQQASMMNDIYKRLKRQEGNEK